MTYYNIDLNWKDFKLKKLNIKLLLKEKKTSSNLSKFLKKDFILKKELEEYKKYLNADSYSEVFYFLINYNSLSELLCPVCEKKKRNFNNFQEGYNYYCSRDCANKCPERRKRVEETNLKVHWSKNVMLNKEISSKALKKSIETLLLSTWYDNPFKNPDSREKALKQQNLKRDEIVESMKKVFLEKRWYENPSKVKFLKEKGEKSRIKTLMKKYNVNIKEEVIEEERKAQKNRDLKNFKEKYKSIYDISLLFSKEYYYKHNSNEEIFTFKCNKGNNIFKDLLTKVGPYNICRYYNCYPKYQTLAEKELEEFFISLWHNKLNLNTRRVLNSKRELDLYITEKKLAIEYNWLYQHS